MRAEVQVMVIVCLSIGKISACSVGKIITVSALSNTSISCPSIMANSSQVKYLLLFNDSRISQIHLYEQLEDSAKILFSGHFDVTASRSGVYTCVRAVLYPPPYSEACRTTEVIVAETKRLSTINNTGPVVDQGCPGRSPVIPDVVIWAGCVVLLVYSLSITCIATGIWRKLKNHEEDTQVYINTRPKGLRKS